MPGLFLVRGRKVMLYSGRLLLQDPATAAGHLPGTGCWWWTTYCSMAKFAVLPVWLQACNRQTIYCVPLYDSLGDETVDYVIEHSGVWGLGCKAVLLGTPPSLHSAAGILH